MEKTLYTFTKAGKSVDVLSYTFKEALYNVNGSFTLPEGTWVPENEPNSFVWVDINSDPYKIAS